MSPPIRDGSGNDIGSIRLGDGSEISEVRTGAGDVLFSGIPDSALTQDLIAWYRFEDGDARDYTNDLDGTFADSTAYDGTVNGASFLSNSGVTDFQNGENSGAVNISDSTGDINYPDPPQLENSTEFTIMGWANPNQDPKMLIYGTERDDASNNVELKTDGVRVETGGNRAQATASQPQSMSHFALVWSAPEAEYYIDATSQGTGTGPSQSLSDLDAYTGDYFGRSTDMVVDDIRIYNRALTSSEITSIFNNTKP